MNNNKGKVFVLVAPSGAGKTTIAKRLLEDEPRLKFSVSATTRNPRPGEQNGKDYYFLSESEFQNSVENGKFLEWEEFYNGTRYGTLRSEVDKLLESGYFPLLDIEVKGAMNVKNIYGSRCVSIFIRPPSLDALKDRLEKRGTEDTRSLTLRLERAREEMEYADNFDYIVVNEDLETAVNETREIINEYIAD